MCTPTQYNYRIRHKFGENVKNQFGEIKFDKNVKILIIVVEIAKFLANKVLRFGKIYQICQSFLSPNLCPIWYIHFLHKTFYTSLNIQAKTLLLKVEKTESGINFISHRILK